MRSNDCLNIEPGPMSQTHGSLERVLHRQRRRIKNLVERRLVRATSMAWSVRPVTSMGWSLWPQTSMRQSFMTFLEDRATPTTRPRMLDFLSGQALSCKPFALLHTPGNSTRSLEDEACCLERPCERETMPRIRSLEASTDLVERPVCFQGSLIFERASWRAVLQIHHSVHHLTPEGEGKSL
jgi:hypothetical protein